MKNELLIDTPMAETVLSYAKNAAASGLDGVVCSPLEAALVKERCGADFLTVTPGIRFADSAAGDQKRIIWRAGKSGCVVVGRPSQAETRWPLISESGQGLLGLSGTGARLHEI